MTSWEDLFSLISSYIISVLFFIPLEYGVLGLKWQEWTGIIYFLVDIGSCLGGMFLSRYFFSPEKKNKTKINGLCIRVRHRCRNHWSSPSTSLLSRCFTTVARVFPTTIRLSTMFHDDYKNFYDIPRQLHDVSRRLHDVPTT